MHRNSLTLSNQRDIDQRDSFSAQLDDNSTQVLHVYHGEVSQRTKDDLILQLELRRKLIEDLLHALLCDCFPSLLPVGSTTQNT